MPSRPHSKGAGSKRWARRNVVATGSMKRSANCCIAAQAVFDQRLPPSSAIGRCASFSSVCSRRMSAGPGEVSTGSQAGASAATTRSTSMSSGSAITTGPGRPLVATWNAREISSGTRAASSISVTHLAIEPKTAR